MTEQHPITPPPELVQQWLGDFFGCTPDPELSDAERFLATRAAQYGADQELEACCEWLHEELKLTVLTLDVGLRAARRPKPPSLKQQVLATLQYPKDLWSEDEVDAIRRLVEQLDD
jgi:hypothetical protein